MNKKTARTCAIYVRISVSSEESVSINRQIEAAEQYAAARGWQVTGVFRDEGVSATHNKPEDRKGWQTLLRSEQKFDVVVVWKIDRLARRILDFLHADQALQERGAGVVAVEQSIDMTTPEGRLIASVLAIFAEYEATAISARVAAARQYLLRNGRVVGGTIPFGWQSVPNPDGQGFVLSQDEERIGYVRTMAERTLAGRSIYSTVQWLNDEGVPSPTGKDQWAYSTVERLLRHPVLAGMTPFNPGRVDSKQRGDDVLRGADGLPAVDESVAILPVPKWRAMVAKLDNRDTPQSVPRAMKAKTSGVLSGLLYCAEHAAEPTRMWRGTVQGRHGYYCPVCRGSITNFEHLVIEEFLRTHGDLLRLSAVEEVHEGGAAELPEIELALTRLRELQRAADDAGDDARYDELEEQVTALRRLRREARQQPAEVRVIEREGTQTYAEAWHATETDEERRDVIGDALERVWAIKGGAGKRSDAAKLARLVFEWRPAGQSEPPTDEELAQW